MVEVFFEVTRVWSFCQMGVLLLNIALKQFVDSRYNLLHVSHKEDSRIT